MRLSKELEAFMLPIWGVRKNDKGEVVEKPESYGVEGWALNTSEALDNQAYSKAIQLIELPTLSEFVLRVGKTLIGYRSIGEDEIYEYNHFLRQHNELGMYVTAKDGVVLEEPTMDYVRKTYGTSAPWDLMLHQLKGEFQEAQYEVVFFGWNITMKNEHSAVVENGKYLLNFLADGNVYGTYQTEINETLEQTINNSRLLYVVGK
tara:strand:+ start:223 stop:837 length:615 start_codon:yes stop_codon:yes gene_type:complete